LKIKFIHITLGLPAALVGIMVLGKLADTAMMMRALDSDTRAYSALHDLRRQVQEYKQAQGRFPSDLSEFKVPELKIYGYKAAGGGKHKHRISGTELRPGAGLGDYTVRFSTEIPGVRHAKVAVLGDFNGHDPAKGAMSNLYGSSWYNEARLPQGSHTYRIAVGTSTGSPETVTVGPELQDPNVQIVEIHGFSGDSGHWLYDPQTGLVALGCSGKDTKSGAIWHTR